MGAYFVGIDIGTFTSKGVLINTCGEIICQHSVQHGMENPQPKYFEHDAEKIWWYDFCTISQMLLEKSGIPSDSIKAIGISTLGCDCLPVDEQCKPLRKAILYGIDARSEKEIEYLTSYYGSEKIKKIFGRPMNSGDIAGKILWIKNNEPEVYRKTYKFLTGTSYIVAKLTGNYCIDRYLAYASFRPMYRMDGRIDTEMCHPICSPEQLAEAKTVTDIAGFVTPQAAAKTGLKAGTPVITGTGDSCAEAISSGVVKPGNMMIQFGSTLFINFCTAHLVEDDRVKGTTFTVPGTYVVSAGTNTAGTLTRWYRDTIFPDYIEAEKSTGENAFAKMAADVDDIEPGSCGLITLPYFAGERSPINDAKAKGMVFGLTLAHTRKHLYRSALESVGYSVAQIFDVFREHHIIPEKIMAMGGGIQNRPWMQIVADIVGVTLNIPKIIVGASYGDALMAALSAGYFKDFRELESVIEIADEVKPDKERHITYQKYLRLYTELYKANRDLMHQI